MLNNAFSLLFAGNFPERGIRMPALSKLLRDDAAAAAAEYALILALIGGGIIIAALALGGSISSVVDCVGDTISARANQC